MKLNLENYLTNAKGEIEIKPITIIAGDFYFLNCNLTPLSSLIDAQSSWFTDSYIERRIKDSSLKIHNSLCVKSFGENKLNKEVIFANIKIEEDDYTPRYRHPSRRLVTEENEWLLINCPEAFYTVQGKIDYAKALVSSVNAFNNSGIIIETNDSDMIMALEVYANRLDLPISYALVEKDNGTFIYKDVTEDTEELYSFLAYPIMKIY